MAFRFGRYCLAFCLVVVSGALSATEIGQPATVDALSLLTSNNFDELDRRYSSIQQAYEDGRESDEDLRAAFRVFYATGPALEPHYEEWVRHSPNSYVAHLARGIYYKKVGFDRRGGNFISETTEEQLAGMEAAYAIADQELSASLALDAKPLLSFHHMMDLRSEAGDKVGTRLLLDSALGIDKKAFIVREKYMGTLQTRWGGSVAEMQKFLEECRRAGLSSPHLRRMEEMVVEDEAWVHQYRDGNVRAAVRDYKRAAKINPAAGCQPCAPLMQAADTLLGAKKYKESIRLYSKILASDRDSMRALDNRAFAELQLKQAAAAVADLQRAIELNDAYAEDLLGRMYLVGTSVPQDRDKAIDLLTRAANQNYAPAKELLPMALDKNAQPLVLPGSPTL